MAEDVAGWARSPLAPYVSCTLFSCLTGLAKPDPRIDLAATRQLGVDPEDALYVGDVCRRTLFATPHEVMRMVLASPETRP